jgi:peroxiredoxin
MFYIVIILMALIPANDKAIKNYLEIPSGYQRVEPVDGFGRFIQQQDISDTSAIVYFDGISCLGCDDVHVFRNYKHVHEWEQCADVIMHIRYDYNKTVGRSTSFTTLSGEAIRVKDRKSLIRVFGFCNTRSLQVYDTHSIPRNEIRVGDMLVTGEINPGHAVLITDILASDADTLVVVSQGFTPAQSLHVIPGYFTLQDTMIISSYEFILSKHLRRFN